MPKAQKLQRRIRGQIFYRFLVFTLVGILISFHFINKNSSEDRFKSIRQFLVDRNKIDEIFYKGVRDSVAKFRLAAQRELATETNQARLFKVSLEPSASGIWRMKNPISADLSGAAIYWPVESGADEKTQSLIHKAWTVVNLYGNVWKSRFSNIWIDLQNGAKISTEVAIIQQVHDLGQTSIELEFRFDGNLKQWAIFAAAPLEVSNKIIGKVGVQVDINGFLGRLANEANRDRIYIFTHKGEVLYRPDEQKQAAVNDGQLNLGLENDTAIGRMWESVRYKNEQMGEFVDAKTGDQFIWNRVKNPHYIVAYQYQRPTVWGLLFSIVGLALVLILVCNIIECLIVALTVREQVIHPISNLVDRAQLLLKGKAAYAEQRPDVDIPDEIEHVARFLNDKEVEIVRLQNIASHLNEGFEKIYRKKIEKVEGDFSDSRELKSKDLQFKTSESAGDMAAGIAHEINNPLAVLYGHASLLQRLLKGEAPAKPVAEGIVIKMEDSLIRLKRILDGMLIYSTGKIQGQAAKLTLLDVLIDCERILSEDLFRYRISLKILCSREIKVYVNATQLLQVFINLISNSIDAIRVKEERWIVVDVRCTQTEVTIKVIDSGEGIPVSIAEKMMNPFFTTKDVGKGTGLGLSIVQGILTNFQGKVLYQDKAANTTFEITLPRAQDTT